LAWSKNTALKSLGTSLGEQVRQHYTNLAFSNALETALELVKASNKFIDDAAPWTLYKEGKQTELEEVLYTLLESARLSSFLLSPVIPQIATAIYQQLGFDLDFDQLPTNLDFPAHSGWGLLPANQLLRLAQPVFATIELTTEAAH
jgi:methionyl-tRNA synthetase